MSRATILYVEDDESLSFMTVDHLTREGFEVLHAITGEQGWRIYSEGGIDLCLVDVMLPALDGYSLTKRIREVDASTPILFLTARALKEDRLKGFREGGDDYITKPYAIEELVMKIEVFLRRKSVIQIADHPMTYTIGSYSYKESDRTLTYKDDTRQLTQRESEVLSYFCKHPNQLIHRADVLIKVWGKDDYFLGRSLDVFISKLRKYLAQDASIKIENVHGVGFRFSMSNTG